MFQKYTSKMAFRETLTFYYDSTFTAKKIPGFCNNIYDTEKPTTIAYVMQGS